jgi:hypothetical protein
MQDLPLHSQAAAAVVHGPSPLSQEQTPFFAKARVRRGLIWGIVSTILSATGLIGLALFEQYNGMLSELRADLKHFNETASDYVKKDNLQKCWERIRELHETKLRLEEELRVSQTAREKMQEEIQRLRERLAYVEGMRSQHANLEPASYTELKEAPSRYQPPPQNIKRHPDDR